MIIAFKDNKDGFYQIEVATEDAIPEWALHLTRLTEEERLATLSSSYEGNA
jgi:hypothetical protein